MTIFSLYGFEAKVVKSIFELSFRFTTGDSYRRLLLVFDQNGNVLSLNFDDGSPEWAEKVKLVENSETPYILDDPIGDGMEARFFSWKGIEQSVMERLIGESFVENDFLTPKSRTKVDLFPNSWQFRVY